MGQRRELLPVRISLSIDPSKHAQGQVEIQYWDSSARLQRAAKAWLLCWGGAIAAIFIPIAHFVLVPSLLIAGPIVGSIIHGQKDAVLGGNGTCPGCGKTFAIARSKLQWPLSDLCPECRNEVKISLTS